MRSDSKMSSRVLTLCSDYTANVGAFALAVRSDDSFDIVKKRLLVGSDELTFFFVDGFVKDDALQKIMLDILSLDKLPDSVDDFADRNVAYVETDVERDGDALITACLSGVAVVFGSTFGAAAVLVDARTYPVRGIAEPENDRVMHGSHDGFCETMIFNTAMIRRRVRDPALTVRYMQIGKKSKSDIAVVYLDGTADPGYVSDIVARLSAVDTDALTMGHQSLCECLIKQRWYNPFPKIRLTERPDAAAAEIYEGRIIIICDNSPTALILPTCIFDFLQETNDYYAPPLTGTYLRLLRHLIFWVTLFLTPLWYLAINNPSYLPKGLAFIVPESTGELPILFQMILVELVVDGLKLASMNTPNMLSNSLSVVGGLILGDFAVEIGWLIPEVILYMAFVAIANFSQPSYELGYAFKFLRILLLLLSAAAGIWGFAAGVILIGVLLCTNKTVNGKRNYLYPLIPFDGRALCHLLFRVKKQ